jgi:hypothetical protein
VKPVLMEEVLRLREHWRNKAALMLIAVAALLWGAGTAAAAESSLGIGLGYVKPKDVESTLFLTGDFRFHLSNTFALAPEFTYWKKSQSAAGLTASLEDIQLGLNLVAVLAAGRSVELFFGAGGGLHNFTGNLALRGVSAASDSASKGGLDAFGGIDFKAGDSLRFFVAARYDRVLGLEGDRSDRLDQAKFYGGFRIRF